MGTTRLSYFYALTYSCRHLFNWIWHYSVYLKPEAVFLYNLKNMNLCIIGTIPLTNSKNKIIIIVLAFIKKCNAEGF